MRALLDTNVVLDVLLDREPFGEESFRLWQASDDGLFDGDIASFSIPTIHYICSRHASAQSAGKAVDICLQAFEVAALYRECIIAARRMPGEDFEDNLQIACAITDFPHCIITRNADHFRESPIPVYSPSGFLATLKS